VPKCASKGGDEVSQLLANSQLIFDKLIEAENASFRCFYCGKVGHLAKDCPERKKSSPATEDAESGGATSASGTEDDVEALRELAKTSQSQWSKFLRTENLSDRDPSKHSLATMKRFEKAVALWAQERIFARHVVVCAAIRLSASAKIPSILATIANRSAMTASSDVSDEEGASKVVDGAANEKILKIESVSAIISARVPILTLESVSAAIDHGSVDIDICIDNGLAINNTALLKCYVDIDPRVRPLIMLVKLWAKRRLIKDASNSTLSSYCYAILVIFYLQRKSILPCLQAPDLVREKWKRPAVEGYDISACLDPEEARAYLKEMSAKTSGVEEDADDASDGDGIGDDDGADDLAVLFVDFFRFYGTEFDLANDVVCIRRGVSMKKSQYRPGGRGCPTWRLSVEDPFETEHDLGSVVRYREAMCTIIFEFRRVCRIFTSLAASSEPNPEASLRSVFAPRPLEEMATERCVLRKLQELKLDDEASDSPPSMSATECFLCGGSREHPSRECPQHGLLDTFKALPNICFRCGGIGHVGRECPSGKRGDRKCYICGKAGHEKRNCPNRGSRRARKNRK